MSPIDPTSTGSVMQKDVAATGGGGGGAWTLLSTTTLAAPGIFDVAGISGAYNDLVLVLIVRGADVAADENPYLRFNNDSAANYYNDRLYGNSNVPSSGFTGGSVGVLAGRCPAAGATANQFGYQEWVIPGYASTAWVKMAFGHVFSQPGIAAATTYVYDVGAMWNSIAAITRVQFLGSQTANLATGSQLRIYGIT